MGRVLNQCSLHPGNILIGKDHIRLFAIGIPITLSSLSSIDQGDRETKDTWSQLKEGGGTDMIWL